MSRGNGSSGDFHMMAGQLEAIWVKRMKRGPMDPLDRVMCVAGRGLAGNANQGGRRQVTIFSKEAWELATAPLASPPSPQVRRGNLLVSGVDLTNSRGKVLHIGPVRIRIFGETRPCEQMDEARAGLRAALEAPWAGGAFGEVLDDGEIQVGAPVTLDAAPAAPPAP
jgi:MOSC domain-containing protein YiiM